MSEPHSAIAEFNRAFAAFREANDERLAQLELRKSADVVTEEKLARLDTTLDETRRRLDRMALDKARPPLAREEKQAPSEHSLAFRTYMTSGETAGLKRIEEKALSVGSGPDGGYLAPAPA